MGAEMTDTDVAEIVEREEAVKNLKWAVARSRSARPGRVPQHIVQHRSQLTFPVPRRARRGKHTNATRRRARHSTAQVIPMEAA